ATNTVTNHLAPDSAAHTFTTAGTWYWQAVYSGDALNATATSPCNETLVVQNHPSVATTLSDDATPTPNTATGGSTLTVAVGTAVHDAAVISGATASAGGTIAYAYYTDTDCTLNAVDQTPSPATVTNHLAPDSAAHTFTTAGTWYWQAVYSGDALNATATSPCNETLVVQNHPTLSTTLSDDATPTPNTAASGSRLTVQVGTSVHDAAVISGATASAGGTIAYAYYTDDKCTANAVDQTPATNTVTNHLAPDSAAHTFTTAGTWYWQAVYSGDALNATATSPCNETLVVQNHPSVATTLSDDATPTPNTAAAGAHPTELESTADLDCPLIPGTNASAGGTIAYPYYTDAKCTANAVDQPPATSPVTNHLPPHSASHTFSTSYTCYCHPDQHSFPTRRSSDLPCNETLVVQNHPSVATTLSDDATPTPNTAAGGSTLTVPVGTSVHDAAVISGATASAGGTIAYAYYTDSSCTPNAVDQTPAPTTVTNHLAPDSAAHTFTTAGTWYWQAVYSGDALNATATSPCNETLVVQNHPSVATTLSDDATPTPNTAAQRSTLTVPIGTNVHDTATLSSA